MHELESLPRPLEHVYPFPFNVVNAAVWCALCLKEPLQHHWPEETPAGARYLIRWGQVYAQLFVLRPTERITIVRAHVLAPADPVEKILWHQDHIGTIVGPFLEFLNVVDIQLVSMIRQIAKAEGWAPSPPGTTDEILDWWMLYYPEKTARQIVQLIERIDGRRIPERTLYNRRSERTAEGTPKTTNRGRKKNR